MYLIEELIRESTRKIFIESPRYLGLATDVVGGQVIGEPCIGPKTNYYRIPIKHGRDIVGNGMYFVNCKPLFWKNANCDWGEIWYWFIADTADQPVALFADRFDRDYPMHILCGDIAGFRRGDLELSFFIE